MSKKFQSIFIDAYTLDATCNNIRFLVKLLRADGGCLGTGRR